jgi:predicted ATPase/DNA-binding winged helix-turn-helix (wHTH) protein
MSAATVTSQDVSAAPAGSFPLDLDDRRQLFGLERQVIGIEQSFSFGPYRLIPHRRLLFRADRPLHIGSRALEILLALVERAGDIVTKDELIARAWPKTVVEESNLRVHVAAVRKALGDTRKGSRYVANIPGQGYCFVAPVCADLKPAPAIPINASVAADPLSKRKSRPIGWDEEIHELARQVMDKHLVTLVGPPGIGKTAIAVAAGRRLQESFEDEVRFVELAPVADSHSVAAAIASAFKIESYGGNPLSALIESLRTRRILLIIDSCDRVLEAAGDLAEELIKFGPEIHILGTSREPLRTASEVVHRLSPLAVPPEKSEMTAAQALAFPAVQLFVDRAATTLHGFKLTDCDAPVVADICRKLDGIPLAIELAAYSTSTFSLRDLASIIDGRFRLSMRGRRTVECRHRTLSDALDWSYGALPPLEQRLLRQLAVFPASFTFEDASAVIVHDEISSCDLACGITKLVSKSLLIADVNGSDVTYRLLNTTRMFAWQKLSESAEFDDVTRRHAQSRTVKIGG